MIKSIRFCLFTTQFVNSQEDCEDFLSKVEEHFGEKALPKKFGLYEPTEKSFLDERPMFVKFWQDGMHWNYNFPKRQGSVSSENKLRTTHSVIEYDFKVKKKQEESYRQFLFYFAKRYSADWIYYCFLHDDYIDPADNKLFSSSTVHLETWLAGIPWMGIFGKPYVDLFGKETILSMPVFKTEEITSDMIFFQLTETLQDAINDYEAFSDLRSKVKEHLGKDAFLDQDAWDELGFDAPSAKMLPKFDLVDPKEIK